MVWMPRAFAIHADFDFCIREHVDPSTTGKLAALVRIKYLWLTVLCPYLFQGFNSEIRTYTVGHPSSKDFVTVPIHDCHQIQEATPHWDIGNVSTPNLVRAVAHIFPKQIQPDLMLGVFIAGVGLLIDRDQTHEPH